VVEIIEDEEDLIGPDIMNAVLEANRDRADAEGISVKASGISIERRSGCFKIVQIPKYTRNFVTILHLRVCCRFRKHADLYYCRIRVSVSGSGDTQISISA